MKKSLGRAISSVMIITIFCRGLALVANQFYISYFGASDVNLNIYSYAVSIPNIIFNSLGTAISTVVIPIFAALLVSEKKSEANRFASNVLTIFSSVIILLILIGIAISPILPKFTDFATPETYDFAVKSLMIIMPVMLFYGISFVFQGVLQSFGSFAFPAAVSLPSSLIIISYVLLFADKYGVLGLLWATFLGLFMQAAMLIPPAVKAGFKFTLQYDFKNPHIRQAFSLIVPVLIGSGAFQINMFYNVTLMANFKNTVTLLTFVQNLVLNTVLAVVYSVTAVLYPKMTREVAANDKFAYKQTLTGGLCSFIFIFLPATVGMILVRTPLLNLISGYGKVTPSDINTAGIILSFYALSFTSIALKELLDRGFFAYRNTKTPAVCGFITVFANIIFSQIAIRFIGPYGIPLSYSLSSICAALFLLFKMQKEIKIFQSDIPKTFLVSIISSVIMGLSVYFTLKVLPPISGILGNLVNLLVPMLIGTAVYAIISIVLKNPVAMKVVKR